MCMKSWPFFFEQRRSHEKYKWCLHTVCKLAMSTNTLTYHWAAPEAHWTGFEAWVLLWLKIQCFFRPLHLTELCRLNLIVCPVSRTHRYVPQNEVFLEPAILLCFMLIYCTHCSESFKTIFFHECVRMNYECLSRGK